MLRLKSWWLLALLCWSAATAAESTRFLIKLHSDGFLAGHGIWTAEVREGKTGLAINAEHLLPALERAGWGGVRRHATVLTHAVTLRGPARFVSVDLIERQLGLSVKADAQRRTLWIQQCSKQCGLFNLR